MIDKYMKIKKEIENLMLVYLVKDEIGIFDKFRLSRLRAMNDVSFVKTCKEQSLDYKELLTKKHMLELR